jgi:hypothetical protein
MSAPTFVVVVVYISFLTTPLPQHHLDAENNSNFFQLHTMLPKTRKKNWCIRRILLLWGTPTGTGWFPKSVVSKTDEFVLSNFNYKKIDGWLVLCSLVD